MCNWVNNALKCRFENKHHGTSIFLRLKVHHSGWLAIRAFIRSHESVSPSPNTKETLLVMDDVGKTKVRKTKLLMNVCDHFTIHFMLRYYLILPDRIASEGTRCCLMRSLDGALFQIPCSAFVSQERSREPLHVINRPAAVLLALPCTASLLC
jgi:hypothetical protein